MEIVVLALIPALLGLLNHRLGMPRVWVQAWWVFAVVAAGALLLPAGVWSGLASGAFLIPALWLAANGVSRGVEAVRLSVDPAERRGWLVGQALISLGLCAPAVLGWALVARTLGVDVSDDVVARVVVGGFGLCLLAGEMILASMGRVSMLAGGVALATVVAAGVSGQWWLVGAAVTLALIGISVRREVRPAVPGAPGLDGGAALLGGIGCGVALWFLPWLAAAVIAALGIAATAWLWRRVVVKLSTVSHSGGCSCCSHQDESGAENVAEKSI